MEEIWKDINGYEGLYQISNLGRVKSLQKKVWTVRNNSYSIRKEKILKLVNRHGYYAVELFNNGIGKMKQVHRLIAIEFIPNVNNKKEINHINGIRNDNRIENLEWCTRSENAIHSVIVLKKNVGISNKRSKLNPEKVLKIKELLLNKKLLNHTYNSIAELFDVSVSTIFSINKGVTWV